MAQKRKRNRKWISRAIILVLLIAAVVVIYLVWDSYFSDRKQDEESGQSVEQVEENKPTQEDNVEIIDETSDEPKVVQYDGKDPNTSDELSGVITYAGVSGGNLMIRVNIDQYLEDGNCTLSLARGGSNIYSSVARVATSASTATCEGFDVPVSEIGGGVIDIVIDINADGKDGVIRGEVQI